MKCPACKDSELLVAERRGVEIDYCPTCRGVWLDHGELDTIIGRGGEEPAETQTEPDARGREAWPHDKGATHSRGDRRDSRMPKRGGFLSELFGGFGGD